MSNNPNIDPAAAGGSMIGLLVGIVLSVILIVGMWKVFEKAGKPGWAAIVPFYNMIVLLEIVGKPLWWLVLFFIPLVNIYATIVVYLDLAKSFGQSAGFAIGLLFLSFVFMPLLGFGDSRYPGPAGAQQSPVPAYQ